MQQILTCLRHISFKTPFKLYQTLIPRLLDVPLYQTASTCAIPITFKLNHFSNPSVYSQIKIKFFYSKYFNLRLILLKFKKSQLLHCALLAGVIFIITQYQLLSQSKTAQVTCPAVCPLSPNDTKIMPHLFVFIRKRQSNTNQNTR